MFLLGPTILMSQSYPKYYQAGLNCSWLVRVPPHQRVVTRVLDLQLGDSTTSCEDKLQIEDTVLDCGELQSESHVLSRGPTSLIQFHTGEQQSSNSFIKFDLVATSEELTVSTSSHIAGADSQQYIQPYRGWLLEVSPLGCTPDMPVLNSEVAILVSHNSSHANYRCRSGMEFLGEEGPVVTLTCRGHHYDRQIPSCRPRSARAMFRNNLPIFQEILHLHFKKCRQKNPLF